MVYYKTRMRSRSDNFVGEFQIKKTLYSAANNILNLGKAFQRMGICKLSDARCSDVVQ